MRVRATAPSHPCATDERIQRFLQARTWPCCVGVAGTNPIHPATIVHCSCTCCHTRLITIKLDDSSLHRPLQYVTEHPSPEAILYSGLAWHTVKTTKPRHVISDGRVGTDHRPPHLAYPRSRTLHPQRHDPFFDSARATSLLLGLMAIFAVTAAEEVFHEGSQDKNIPPFADKTERHIALR